MAKIRKTLDEYEFWYLSCEGYLCLHNKRPVVVSVPDWVGPALVIRLSREEYHWSIALGPAIEGGKGLLYEVRRSYRLKRR